MKKIAPGIGAKAKRFRKPCEKLTGFGRKGIKKRKTRVKKNGRKRSKRRSK